MTEHSQVLVWTYATGDVVIAASCFVIAASLAYLAVRHRRAKLALVFHTFGILFTLGGVMGVCEAGAALKCPYAYELAAVFKSLTAVSVAACAVVTVRCVPQARAMFARVAAFSRIAEIRDRHLATDPRYDTPEDREWRGHLAEIRELARLAREVKEPEGI